MRNEQKVTWIAVLALLSNVNVHCQDLDECLHTIKDLSMKLIDCHQDLAYRYVMYSVTCEGSSATLSCPGTRLHIEYANYGRITSGEKLCPNPAIHDLNCRSANSFSIVTTICESSGSCTLTASDSVFGNPCPGTYKYLEVYYSCL